MLYPQKTLGIYQVHTCESLIVYQLLQSLFGFLINPQTEIIVPETDHLLNVSAPFFSFMKKEKLRKSHHHPQDYISTILNVLNLFGF